MDELGYNPIIVLDSPTGFGGTTTGKLVSEYLGLKNFFSAGEFYRAITSFALQQGNNGWSPEDLAQNIDNLKIELVDNEFFIEGKHIDRETLHFPEIGGKVSFYSPNLIIRNKIEGIIKSSVLDCKGGVFIEGRPLGWEMFGNMRDDVYSVFGWASARTRAERKWTQMLENGKRIEFEKLLEQNQIKDYNDMNREHGRMYSLEEAMKAVPLYYDDAFRNDGKDVGWTAERIVCGFHNKFPQYCHNQ